MHKYSFTRPLVPTLPKNTYLKLVLSIKELNKDDQEVLEQV